MRILNNVSLSGAMVGVAAIVIVTGASAEQQTREVPEQQQARQTEMQQIQQKLIAIQERTVEANPELQEQRENLETLATDAMEDAGYDPDALTGTLQSAQADLQDESLSEEEKMQTLREAREAQQELQKAEQAVMQDEEVVQAREEFQSNLMTAMREEDPEVNQLIERFQQLRQEMQGDMQR